MSDREKLDKLHQISQLMLDIRLFALEQAARARQASLDNLADLNKPHPAHDLNPIVAGEVVMRYENWADERRADINMTLARQTATWAEARQEAALAFGKDSVIRKLQDRQG
jgi:hypothetical protein